MAEEIKQVELTHIEQPEIVAPEIEEAEETIHAEPVMAEKP